MLAPVFLSLALQAAAATQPPPLLEQAARSIAQGDLAGAEQKLAALLKLEPRNVGALGNLGIIYARTDRLNQAIAVYRKALALAPKEPGLLLNLGLAYLKQQDYAAAKPLFQRIAQQGAPSRQVRELLATAQLFTGETAAALRALEQLNREDPANTGVLYNLAVGYLKNNDKPTAAQALGNLLQLLTPEQAHYLAGKAYYETALFEEAERELKLAGAAGALDLAKTYLSLRRNDEAEKVLRQLRSPEAVYYLGALLLQGDRPAEGEALLREYLGIQPDSWSALYYLGKYALQQRRWPEALERLEAAAKLNPAESAIWFQLSQTYRQVNRPGEARAAAAKASALKRGENAPPVLGPR